MKNRYARFSKVVMCGIFFAAIGFSWALATTSATADGADPRAPGVNPRTPLRYFNPVVDGGTDRDLGDAAFGSVITRYIRAYGGFPPIRYTSLRTNTEFMGSVALSEGINALTVGNPSQSTLALFPDGMLDGKVGVPTRLIGSNGDGFTVPLRFDVTASDSRTALPNRLTETFRLTLVDNATFKFARQTLNGGITFRDYVDKIEVIGGRAPYRFSVSQITLTTPTGTTNLPSLEDAGLFLNPRNGRIIGRPLQSGTIRFLVACNDADNNRALARDRNSVDQLTTINVEASGRAVNDILIASSTITGDIGRSGRDTMKISALVNLDGNSLSDLAGLDVQVTVGNYTSPSVELNSRGQGRTLRGRGPALAATLGKDGLLKIAIGLESFARDGAIFDGSPFSGFSRNLPVFITIGNRFSSTELLSYSLRGRGNKFTLSYNFGRNSNLTGAYYINTVSGKDDLDTGEADFWRVTFLAQPRVGTSLAGATTATVAIGTEFTDSIQVRSSGTTLQSTELRDSAKPTILLFTLKKNKGQLVTGKLPNTSTTPNAATGIGEGLNAQGKRNRFPMIITIDSAAVESFGGEGSRAIFSKKAGWDSKNPSKPGFTFPFFP